MARFLFIFALLLYPLLSLLWRRDYPFASAEVLLIVIALAVIGILLVTLLGRVRSGLAGAFTALLITLVFVIQFDLALLGLIACGLVSLVLVLLLKENLARFGLPVLAALILGAWLDAREMAGKGIEPLGPGAPPPVVHILLDGFIGPDGLPKHPGSARAREDILDFMQTFGFQVFPRAYSRYSITRDSMYSVFNFSHDGYTAKGQGVTRKQHRLEANAMFEMLAGAGYGIRVFQTDFLDFCAFGENEAERCWRYLQPNLLAGRDQRELRTRVSALVHTLLGQSVLISGRVAAGAWLEDAEVAVHDPQVFEELENDILAGAAGRYFFAHALLPHAPFVFGRDCSPRYAEESWLTWQANKAQYSSDPEDRPRQLRIGLYQDQQACALASLTRLFEAMQSAGAFDQALVVLHGDHGPFISRRRPALKLRGRLGVEDYRSNFSTLFAVKFPHGKFAVDDRALSLGLLMEAVAAVVPGHAAGQSLDNRLVGELPDDPDKSGQFLFLTGSYPLQRVDIDIFED